MRAIQWSRYYTLSNYIPPILSIPVALIALLLAGCTSSNGVSKIFLTSLSYSKTDASRTHDILGSNLTQSLLDAVNNTQLEVRTGYLGLCARRAGGSWYCNNDVTQLSLRYGPSEDPLNLIALSATFKDQIFFPGLFLISAILATIALVLVAFQPRWITEADENDSLRDVKPFPGRLTQSSALACAFTAATFGLIAILWQHIGSVAAIATFEKVAASAVVCEVGPTATALGWTAAVISLVPSMVLYMQRLDIDMLDRLTDDD